MPFGYGDLSVAANKLILLPSDPATAPVATDRLAGALQALGLISTARPLGAAHFYPCGEQFLQLISFLGCSPNIELQPPDDPVTLAADSASGKFCHVFLNSSAALLFRADLHLPTPRCPACRTALQQWPTCLQQWHKDPASSRWQCSHCQHSDDITALLFRKTGGFGHTFVEIRGIYPSEAVAGEALLGCLQALTGGAWHTLYIKE